MCGTSQCFSSLTASGRTYEHSIAPAARRIDRLCDTHAHSSARGARADRRRVADRHRHRSKRRGRARRDRHGDQPGDQRHVHRRLERGRQLHRHLAAGRQLCGQSRALELQDRRDQADPGRGECRSCASTSSWSSARSRRPSRSPASRRCCRPRSATVGEVISGTTLSALPLNGRNTGQLSLLLPGVVTPNPELVHRRSATSAAAGRT